MDFSSVGFSFVIVFVGGVAAYVGDNLGKKIGKKRLSYAGLRPRHTAGLLTFLFGFGVSLLTIILVLLLSAPVREWFVHGSRAIEEAKRVTQQLEQEKTSLASVQQQEQSLNVQLSLDKGVLESQKSQINRQRSSIAKAKDRIATLNATIQTKNSLIDLNQRKLLSKESELQKVTASLGPLTHQLEIKTEEFDRSFAKLNTADQTNKNLQSSIGKQRKEVASLKAQKDELKIQKDELERTRQTLLSEVTGYQTQLLSLKSDLGSVNSELQKVSEKLQTAETQERELAEGNEYLQKDFVNTRTHPLIFSQYQEITRLTVKANLTSKEADDALDRLMVETQMQAATHGARAQGDFKVADIIDRPDGMRAEQIRQKIHDKITGNKDPLVLIALSSLNFYEHEPVAYDVVTMPNPLVYHKGDVLAQTQVNGNGSDSDIIHTFSVFGMSIRDRALKDKMIRQPNGDGFGSVPPDEVFSLVNSIKQAGRDVWLQAVAATDIRAADPLKINFRIR